MPAGQGELRGVALASARGKVLADWARGTPEAKPVFHMILFRPIPFHFMPKPAVIAGAARSLLQGRLGR